MVEPPVSVVVQSGRDDAVDAERLEVRQELVDAVPAGGRGERALGEAEDVDGHAGRMAQARGAAKRKLDLLSGGWLC